MLWPTDRGAAPRISASPPRQSLGEEGEESEHPQLQLGFFNFGLRRSARPLPRCYSFPLIGIATDERYQNKEGPAAST